MRGGQGRRGITDYAGNKLTVSTHGEKAYVKLAMTSDERAHGIFRLVRIDSKVRIAGVRRMRHRRAGRLAT